MSDRTALLEAALDSIPEGIALLGSESEIVCWNQAAETITGFSSQDLLFQPAPALLEPLLDWSCQEDLQPGTEAASRGAALIRSRHKLGHELQVIARARLLRDPMGAHIGAAVVFHPARSIDALPHGESGEVEAVKVSQAELEDRLQIEFDDFAQGGQRFGVLWITVDQAYDLRKTHGAMACEAMLEKLEHALLQVLRPAEELGRWGSGEFLVIAHERSPEMLAAHAQALAGVARTADFRWWGDRLSLTVSIGAAQVEEAESLAELLDRAKAAMFTSIRAGGNHVSVAPGGQPCLPS
jgi:diguanylate cyclase (GGDEF)-like protein/PAS domain S-box-containing protein